MNSKKLSLPQKVFAFFLVAPLAGISIYFAYLTIAANFLYPPIVATEEELRKFFSEQFTLNLEDVENFEGKRSYSRMAPEVTWIRFARAGEKQVLKAEAEFSTVPCTSKAVSFFRHIGYEPLEIARLDQTGKQEEIKKRFSCKDFTAAGEKAFLIRNSESGQYFFYSYKNAWHRRTASS